MRQPFGHGIGRAAETLGYANAVGTVTIDNYYLSIALEAGLLGFVAYYGAFLAAFVAGALHFTKSGEHEETSWLLPTMLSLGCFVVIKSVLSQQENHPLAFAILGLTVILVHKVKLMSEDRLAARTAYKRSTLRSGGTGLAPPLVALPPSQP
jgi:O-antigen ligase